MSASRPELALGAFRSRLQRSAFAVSPIIGAMMLQQIEMACAGPRP